MLFSIVSYHDYVLVVINECKMTAMCECDMT